MYECAYNLLVDYQWDDNKAKANLKKHNVDFADAVTVFGDDLPIRSSPSEYLAAGSDVSPASPANG